MTSLNASPAPETPIETKHTAGPWQADWFERPAVGQESGWFIYGPDSSVMGNIADLSCCDGNRPHEEIAATARLMAAAPDLLYALEKCVQVFAFYANESSPTGGTYGYGAAIRAARYAVAKATGGK
jgi:hypothetical protein